VLRPIFSRFIFRAPASLRSTPAGSDERGVAAYRYELPAELIARVPAARRDEARLLVVDPDAMHDRTFGDFPALLRAGDVLVINETRVVPARLRGTRAGGGRAEILLLRPRDGDGFDYAARDWLALVRPGKRLLAGARIDFGDTAADIVDVLPDGPRIVRFGADVDLRALLEARGEMPLPPYVGPGDAAREARYQTIFARVPGSVAAPTASLHFSAAVLTAIQARGVTIAPLVLDVGIATFRPMSGERIDEHVMHAERYSVPAATAAAIAQARAAGGRIVAAGTTVVRALESAARADGTVAAGNGTTELFIAPGFPFKIVDALLTNFHLPQSTLLVLVAAFAGRERVLAAYAHAIAERYRFFSFGDAMFVYRTSHRDTSNAWVISSCG
jgi:S-adenosylmethionine:tRNA ribosyltransferase-isomerase